MEKHAHEDWRNSVVESISKKKGLSGISFSTLFSFIGVNRPHLIYLLLTAACKPTRQTNLDFMREGPESHKLEVLKANEPDQIAADTTVGDDFSNGDVD